MLPPSISARSLSDEGTRSKAIVLIKGCSIGALEANSSRFAPTSRRSESRSTGEAVSNDDSTQTFAWPRTSASAGIRVLTMKGCQAPFWTEKSGAMKSMI
jgi:hypothetical protein